MRKLKKYIVVILSLILVSPILVFCITNIGNTSGVPILEFGSVEVIEVNGTLSVYYEEDSISDIIVRPVFGTEPVGITGSFARMSIFLENEIGIASALTMVIFSYMLYTIAICLAFFLLDIIIFIPRKCEEFLGGCL